MTSMDREKRLAIEKESDEENMDLEGENEDRSSGNNVPDHSIYGRRELDSMFDGYTEVPVVVPSKVLHCRGILPKSIVES